MKHSPSKQLSILSSAVAGIAHEATEKRRVEVVLDAVARLGLNKECLFSVYTRVEDDVIQLSYALGQKKLVASPGIRYSPRRQGLTSHILQRKEDVLVDVRSKPESFESLLAMPIFKNNTVIGVFNVSSTKGYAFSERDIQTLQPFCSLLSFALDLPSQMPKTNLVDVITRFREKQILVLGKDDGPEIERLHAIRDCLNRAGYQPLLVKDHPDIPELSNEEKVRVFADASRFVILENTFPAGQIAELKMCATNRIITAALREKGKGSSFMVTDYFKDFDFIREFEYCDHGALNSAVESALKWGEQKIQERAKYYDDLYPWRSAK